MSNTQATPTPGGQAAADRVTSQQTPAASGASSSAAPSSADSTASAGQPISGATPEKTAATAAPSPAGPSQEPTRQGPAQPQVGTHTGPTSGKASPADNTVQQPQSAAQTQQNVPASQRPKAVEFSGSVNGPYAIYGENFGTGAPGSFITINGRPVAVTSWRPNAIKGIIPADFEPGNVTVSVAGVSVKGKLG